jgi:lipoprotein-anchoring transpeptidase ErfK/SrfK
VGETLESIAGQVSLEVTALWIENDISGGVVVGDLVDVCVDNRVDDRTGEPAPDHDDRATAVRFTANVERQQRHLNELFAPYSGEPLVVDGISGPRTGQRLCAARVALGLEPTVDDMLPGSDDEVALMSTGDLPTPMSTATGAERWALIDRTCQMMFIGSGEQLVFVFPTSTGSEGFETRDQDRANVFRYNPAVDNGGWHDSTEFPVGVDNPLNGNLYKPLYFDLGQAIHGANNVPPTPESKGCARLSVADQERLLSWLGLLDDVEETWRTKEIDFTVNVQGEFVGR